MIDGVLAGRLAVSFVHVLKTSQDPRLRLRRCLIEESGRGLSLLPGVLG